MLGIDVLPPVLPHSLLCATSTVCRLHLQSVVIFETSCQSVFLFLSSGETSAGKSSLLNLLLGTDVLPHSLLCATSTVCRLHNSDKKKVDIEPFTGDHIRIKLEDGESSSDNLHEKLKQYISSKESRAENLYKNVDIYWPLPMLMVS